jgi:hypothetical protein
MPPSERKRTEQAIEVGNEFIRQYLDGRAFGFEEEYERDWLRDTGPLMAMSLDEWKQLYYSNWERKKIKMEDGIAYEGRDVCPQASLFSVRRYGEDLALEYTTVAVGGLMRFQGDMYAFDPQWAGEPYQVRIELNSNNRIAKVVPQDPVITSIYTLPLNYLKEFVRKPEPIGTQSQAHANAKLIRYQKTIGDMERQAVRVCK